MPLAVAAGRLMWVMRGSRRAKQPRDYTNGPRSLS